MRLRDWALLLGTASGAMFTYGMLVESKRLTLERRTLRLPRWPERLAGFRIAVLADFHLRGRYSLELAQKAVVMALEEDPDMVVIPGDFVDYWREDSRGAILDLLSPLLIMDGSVVAVPGNHDYYLEEDAGRLAPILADLNIRFLRNEVWVHKDITWVGLDSAVAGKADPICTILDVDHLPAVAVWHEADLVHQLPIGCALQISGHSHGGQFRFPLGLTPAHSYLGKKYPEGFYPEAPTPLYVSRGVGTTGPPSRFLCPPEVSLLTLLPL